MKITFKYITLSLLAGASLLTSCEDFLDREPLDSVTPDTYLKNESQLAAYAINAYSFNIHSGYNGGPIVSDNGTDNQATASPNTTYWEPGQWRVGTYDAWGFGTIRNLNYFLEIVIPRWEAGEIEGVEKNIKQYIGEIYFLRAWEYFSKLQNLGDFPILTKVLSDKKEDLIEASKRRPRNEVARFILADLDKATEMMKETAPESNRLTKYVALLLKSRVALYEGTWLKYHAGTDRVPGGPGWPGANASYLKDFTIDLNSEINFFLSEAKKASQEVADAFPLGDYSSMFNSVDLSDMKEVLLWRRYDISLKVFHYVVSYLQTVHPSGNGCGNTGFTRTLVESVLMKNGLPIYASGSGYKGDKTLEDVATDRDNRFRESISIPGDPINSLNNFTRPGITIVTENKSTTGYCLRKGLNQDISMGPTLPSNTGCVIFRAAEAYLNYIEANYELDHNLDAKSTAYWKALRNRAGVDEDFQKTIAATDLSKENDFATYSGEQLVDATLYNIRRERRIEFLAEGFRLDDLYRWRALDRMKDYQVEGFNLWDENYKLYDDLKVEGETDEPNVSSRYNKYLRPYQIQRNNKAYLGYTFMKAHYLAPIANDVIRLSTPQKGGDISTAYIYQNPGWDVQPGTSAKK